eukprot:scaffold173665_cov17-Tisochrysis_lutea.AAC.2
MLLAQPMSLPELQVKVSLPQPYPAHSLPASTPKVVQFKPVSKDAIDLSMSGQDLEDPHSPLGNGGDIEQGIAGSNGGDIMQGEAEDLPCSAPSLFSGKTASSAQEPIGTDNLTKTLTKSQQYVTLHPCRAYTISSGTSCAYILDVNWYKSRVEECFTAVDQKSLRRPSWAPYACFKTTLFPFLRAAHSANHEGKSCFQSSYAVMINPTQKPEVLFRMLCVCKCASVPWRSTRLQYPNIVPVNCVACLLPSQGLTQYHVLKLLWRSKHLQHPNIVPAIGVVWSLPPLAPSIPVLVRECQELGSLTEVRDQKAVAH